MERPALLLLSEPQESHSKDEPVYLYTELNSITVLIQKGTMYYVVTVDK